MYLLDTDVLSHLAPSRAEDALGVREWVRRSGGLCFLSAVSIAEISYGVHRLQHRGATRRAEDLRTWLDVLPVRFPGRILPVDDRVATRAGELLARAEAAGIAPGMEDAMVAAAADTRGMTVLTRNLRHFLPMAVAAIDPFATLPGSSGGPG